MRESALLARSLRKVNPYISGIPYLILHVHVDGRADTASAYPWARQTVSPGRSNRGENGPNRWGRSLPNLHLQMDQLVTGQVGSRIGQSWAFSREARPCA